MHRQIAAAGEILSGIDSAVSGAYQSYFGSVAESAAKADVSLGGVDCEDCGNTAASKSDSKPKGGRYWEASADFVFGGGYGFALGKVYDASGNSKWYFRFDSNIGYGADWNLSTGAITPTGDHSSVVNDFGGNSGSYNTGITLWGMDASYHTGGSVDKNWSGRDKLNYNNFGRNQGDIQRGYKTTQIGAGRGTGFRAGGYYSYGTTKVFN